MDNIDLDVIEKKIAEYIYDKKGKSITVSVLRNGMPLQFQIMSIYRALYAYDYILEQERKASES